MDKTEAYTETLATLRRDLTDVEARAKKLREAIAIIEELVPRDGRSAITARPTGEFAELSMIDAAETVLRTAGRPMYIVDLMRDMLARGFAYDKGQAALRASLTTSLERKDDFERTAPATYGLAIWSQNGKHEKQNAGAA